MQRDLAARTEVLWVRVKPFAADLLQNRVFLSCVVHGTVLFFVLNAWWFGAKRMKPAGSPHGVQVMMNTAVGRAAPRPAVERRAPKLAPKRATALDSVSKPAATPEVDAASLMEALGDGPATILYVQSFPAQRPQMPGGALTRDLIVDVQIDENGRVMQTHKERGMGASVDDVIVATVQQWIFHPATKNGNAVPSVQELHFHFDARRNPGCGWECIQLQVD
jgi:periplasmic protein TonB